MRKHYQAMVSDADARVDRSLQIQYLEDPSSPYYGGFRDTSSLIEAKYAIYRTTTMIVARFNPDSRWYGSSELLRRIGLGIGFIERTQRENGFFDLNDCNFYSGPDTAFCLKRMLPVYCWLQRELKDDPDAAAIAGRFGEIIVKGADALLKGGFHTPNHRWAIASVLYFCAKVFCNDLYSESAMRYLAEGLDCNADGEYTERSAGNYNRINNDAMIMLAIASGDDSFYEPVIRNLRMMLTYIEPDGSVFTNNSTRQDRGTKKYLKDYYFEYLYMGHRFNIPEFLAAANYIMDVVEQKGLTHMDSVVSYLNNPELIDLEYDGHDIPDVYTGFYRESNILRARNGHYSYSLINNCPSFLYFQSGELTLGVKIGASFCEHRSFISQTMEETETSDGRTCYHLSEKMLGWYYLPFKEDQGTSDWWKMDHSKREKIYGPDMIFDINVTPVDGGLDMQIRTSGIDRAPLRVELAFDAGCRIDSPSFTAEGIPGGAMIAREGTIEVSKGVDCITVGPCFGTHGFTAGKFGSDSRSSQCFTVYLTDTTCFEHTLHIRAGYSRY